MVTVAAPPWARWKSKRWWRSTSPRPTQILSGLAGSWPREKELLAQTFAHLHDSTTRVGLLARVDHLDLPTGRQGLREFRYQLGLVTSGQDEVGEPLVGIDLHHVGENRTVSDQQ